MQRVKTTTISVGLLPKRVPIKSPELWGGNRKFLIKKVKKILLS